MIKTIAAAILGFLVTCSLHAQELTVEAGAGWNGAHSLRLGYGVDLAPRWTLDTGTTLIEYGGGRSCVGAIDTILLWTIPLGPRYFLSAGSGMSVWTTKKWNTADSETLWMFAHKFAIGMNVGGGQANLFYRHASNGIFTPNTGVDIFGVGYAIRF